MVINLYYTVLFVLFSIAIFLVYEYFYYLLVDQKKIAGIVFLGVSKNKY